MKYVLTIILALSLSIPTFAEDGFKWCLYFFNFNSPMRPEYEAQLEELAEFIKSYPDSLFEISGHLDMRASDMYSIRLDFKRAEYIRQYLIENYCIPDTMLVAVGRRNHEPYIKDAKTEAEHEWNRRAEIKFISKEDY